MSESLKTLRARLGAHTLHATHDPRETTVAARAAFARRFEDAVDPERVLSETERARRVEHARKAYFTKLALESAKARRQRARAKVDRRFE